jgi:argininosuccinate lyase
MTNNLPSGYFRDLQLIKEIYLPTFAELKSCLAIASFAISNIKVNNKIMEDPRYDYVYSVEEVNKRVLEGVPFREAYRQVGEEINNGHFQPDKNIHHSHEGSIGNLCLSEVSYKMKKVLNSFNFTLPEKAFRQLLFDENDHN